MDLRPHMASKNGPPMLYDLFAAIFHTGGKEDEGQYYAMRWGPDSGWQSLGDAQTLPSSFNSNALWSHLQQNLHYVMLACIVYPAVFVTDSYAAGGTQPINGYCLLCQVGVLFTTAYLEFQQEQ